MNSPKVLRKINNMKKEKLIKYLQDELKIIEVVEIRKLSELAANKAQVMRTKFPLVPSFFAALFLSVWNSFLNWMYSTEIVQSLELALSILGNATLLIVMVIGFYIIISGGFTIIFDDIFNKDSKTMLYLSGLLKEIGDDLERNSRDEESVTKA